MSDIYDDQQVEVLVSEHAEALKEWHSWKRRAYDAEAEVERLRGVIRDNNVALKAELEEAREIIKARTEELWSLKPFP